MSSLSKSNPNRQKLTCTSLVTRRRWKGDCATPLVTTETLITILDSGSSVAKFETGRPAHLHRHSVQRKAVSVETTVRGRIGPASLSTIYHSAALLVFEFGDVVHFDRTRSTTRLSRVATTRRCTIVFRRQSCRVGRGVATVAFSTVFDTRILVAKFRAPSFARSDGHVVGLP